VPSWSPAVPPPPVCGALLTTGVGDAATVTLGVAAAVGITVAVGMTVAVGRTVTVGATVPAGVAWAEMPLAGVGGTDPPAVATNVVADADGRDGDDEQPDTAATLRTAMAPMPTAVSSARGVRTLFRYPPGQP
jgi:hypothetical protein